MRTFTPARLPALVRATSIALVLAVAACLTPTASAQTQFAPYFGKNAIRYDNFKWHTYQSDHFEIYYYPEIEPHLERMAGYAESAYQHISSELKHDLAAKVPLILFQTSAEFYQQNVIPGAAQEGVGAFAEPSRYRILMPMDEPPDLLYRLIVHELTHIFQFDIIPTSLIRNSTPLWVNEGMSDYMTGVWRPNDIMMVRDAAIADIIPKMSNLQGYGDLGSPRGIYNLGHAAFEFMEARWGKEGVRQYVFALRKSIIGGGDDAYQEAFQISADEWDTEFDRYLKERFKPFRDKERPADYGRNLAPAADKTRYSQAYSIEPSPSGDLIAAMTGNSGDRELDIVLLSAKDGSVIRNLTPGFDQSRGFEYIVQPGGRWNTVPWMSWSPSGDRLAFFVRTEKDRSLVVEDVISRKIVQRFELNDVDAPESPDFSPDGKTVAFSAMRGGVTDVFTINLDTKAITNITKDAFADYAPTWTPDGKAIVVLTRVSGNEKLFRVDPATGTRTQLTFGTHDEAGAQYPRRRHAGVLVDGGRSERDGRSRGGQERHDLQPVDAQPEDQRAAPLHRCGQRQPVAGGAERRHGGAAHRLRELLQGRLQRARARPEGAARQAGHDRRLRLARADRGLPGAPHAHARGRQPEEEGQVRQALSRGPAAGERRASRAAATSWAAPRWPSPTCSATSSSRSSPPRCRSTARSRGRTSTSNGASSTRCRASRRRSSSTASSRASSTTRASAASSTAISPSPPPPPAAPRRSASGRSTATGASSCRAAWCTTASSSRTPGLQEYSQGYQQQQFGRQLLNNGTMVPFGLAFIQETTVFREFGPLAGNTVRLSYEVAPKIGSTLSRQTADLDVRKYFRLGGSGLLALRAKGFKSWGDNPGYYYFGGNSEMRGYDYLSFVGQNAGHVNAELRIPLIHAMATPIGILGGVRGTLFANVGGAAWANAGFKAYSREASIERPIIDYAPNPADPSAWTFRSTAIRCWSRASGSSMRGPATASACRPSRSASPSTSIGAGARSSTRAGKTCSSRCRAAARRSASRSSRCGSATTSKDRGWGLGARD